MTPWFLWQLADSAFPSGGFAHSAGLEAAWQSGEVPSAGALQRFLREVVWQAAHGLLPLVTAAHRAPERVAELDALCDAFLVNAVANRASRIQGRALLTTCSRVWPLEALSSLEARARTLCGHYGPIAGAAFQAIGVPLADTQRLVLYTAARGVLSAAVRLGIVGPYAAQRLQHDCAADLDGSLTACASLDDRDLAQTAPIIDILQGAHDRLYSRLFQT
jgi:urease accessory protein